MGETGQHFQKSLLQKGNSDTLLEMLVPKMGKVSKMRAHVEILWYSNAMVLLNFLELKEMINSIYYKMG